MKKILLAVAATLFVALNAFAEFNVPFFNGASSALEVSTTFTGDLNDGSTGLYTDMGCDLWFELTPFKNYGTTERKNPITISLSASGWVTAWRGYTITGKDNFADEKDNDEDGIESTFALTNLSAKIQYRKVWASIAGIYPQITMNTTSIRTMFDDVIAEDYDDDNQYFQLPLLHVGGGYSTPKISQVIGMDLVHLDEREVQIYGMYAVGYDGDMFKAILKAGSWKNGYKNADNSWVFGADFSLTPVLGSKISFTSLYAINYDVYSPAEKSRDKLTSDDEVITSTTSSSQNTDGFQDEDEKALAEAPLAFGIGYEHDFQVGSAGVLRPYVGADFLFQTKRTAELKAARPYVDDFQFEIGGGIEWLFFGAGKMYAHSDKVGGMQLANGPSSRVGMGIGANVNQNGVLNAVFSLNVDPRTSPIKLGGYIEAEFMNITRKSYWAPDGSSRKENDKEVGSYYDRTKYDDFLWAILAQVEFQATKVIMPYIFAWYVPSANYMASSYSSQYITRSAYANFNVKPTYNPKDVTLTTKVGVRLTPFDHVWFDLWYERTDIKDHSNGKGWKTDTGMISFTVGINL